MNLDPKALNKYKAALKTALTADKLSKKVTRLIELHANRINDGVTRGLASARAFYAIDRAYDISQHQISPTLMRELIDRNPGSAEVQNLAKTWGLSSMVRHVPDVSKFATNVAKGSEGKPGYILQSPTFFNIFVPILLSYVKIRWAKLFNDRDVHPLYKFEPLVLGTKDRTTAKVVTGRIQRMASEMNYRSVERDSIQKMLLYGQAINFPEEVWYTEKQLIGGKKKITKEGVRFFIPHPTRTFYDLSHPLYTLNSDTGVDWVGYWGMYRYGDIIDNDNFWLPKDKKGRLEDLMIPTGWRGDDAYTNLYQHLYPCTINFPTVSGVGAISENNREKGNFLYNADTHDTGIDVTVFFHKLNPKTWGLYDYDHPVWHRFVYAGNQRVLHCEPVFYCPGVAYLYDYDAERARNSSLGFELLPFQDHMGNLLTQYLLSVKKNLIRIVAVNEDVVGADFRDKVVNFSENALRGIELMPYSSLNMKDQGTEIGSAFQPIPLQAQPTAEIIGAITNLITVLERILGYSSQEVGASASHQQSATEVQLISGSTNTRMNFTAGFVDDAIYARKKLLYYAMMHYSSDDIFVELTDVTPGGKKALEEMGFTLAVNDGEPGIMTVKGTKKNLVFENSFSERDGSNRTQDQQVAVMLTAFLDRLMANPKVGEQIPLKYLFKFFNSVADYLGLPTELKLPEDIEERNGEAQAKQQEAQMGQLQALVSQIVTQTVGPPLEKVSQEVGKNAQETEQAITAVAGQQQQLGQGLQEVGQGLGQVSEALGQVAQKGAMTEETLQMLMVKIDQFLQQMVAPPGEPPAPVLMQGGMAG